MTKYSKKLILLSDILINPKNPRFEPVLNQKQALQLMIIEKESEIKKLGKDIIEKGMNPSKNLIVIQKNNKYLTLEGNRRIISLKLLNNPGLTDNKEMREFFSNLKNEHISNIPSSVNCVIFEKEEDARHWISLEHTGKNQGIGVDSWDREQQHRFSGNASKAVQIFDFTDDNHIDRQNVDTSNMERILTPHTCSVIGISFLDGRLQFDKSKTKVQKNIETVFEKMSKRSFKVRDIYNKEIIEKWIDETLGTNEDTHPTTRKNPSSGAKTTSEKTKNKKSTKRKHLIPENCNLEIEPTKINDIFVELKYDLILDGKKSTPNAVGVLFRVFLETSIDYYLEKKKIPYAYTTKLSTKIYSVSTHMVINKIATSKDVKYVRNTAQRASSNILSVENFHEYVHSKNIRPVPGDLKAYWDNCQEFFEILWKNM